MESKGRLCALSLVLSIKAKDIMLKKGRIYDGGDSNY